MEKDVAIMLPMVHLNGTSRKELYSQYRAAHDAVYKAIDAVLAAAPNGRDYYPIGPDAINKASAEHRARVVAMEAVKAELEALALHVME